MSRMQRRQFLSGALASGTLAQFCLAADKTEGHLSISVKGKVISRLAGYTLPQLRDLYHQDLFDGWLPFIRRYIIDAQYGGFLCNADFDGTIVNHGKNALFEGRGVWVYSYLYTHFGKNPVYLDIARKSVELLRKSQPAGDDLWCTALGRDGTPASPPGKLIPTDLGIAEGLAAYAQASGESEALHTAKQLLWKCVRTYGSAEYFPSVGQGYLGRSAAALPGARILGSWMILLRTAAQIMEIDPDPAVKALSEQCTEAILQHHFSSEFGLNTELLMHDLSRPANEYGGLVNLGNTYESTWMILDEAERRKDTTMFQLCAERFRKHLETGWDSVYGGVFHTLLNVDENRFALNKILWAQTEVLVDALYIYERTGAQWAGDIFSRMYSYVREKYPLMSHGSPLWMYESGRKAEFGEFVVLPKRVENYHHPRHLMLNLLRIERMIAHGGRTRTIDL